MRWSSLWAGVQAGLVAPEWLSNASASPMAFNALALDAPPSVAGIYQLDGIVRRAPALQHTADATQEVFL